MGFHFSDAFIIKGATYDKNSSNLAGFILNCEENISWSHTAKSFTNKSYSPFFFLSMKIFLTQNLFPGFSFLLIVRQYRQYYFLPSTKCDICLLKFGVIRLIGNYWHDLGEIKLIFVRPIHPNFRLKWKLAFILDLTKSYPKFGVLDLLYPSYLQYQNV